MDESKYPLPPSIANVSQSKPLTRMITRMLPKKLKSRLVGSPRKKITTDDVKIKHKKIKYW